MRTTARIPGQPASFATLYADSASPIAITCARMTCRHSRTSASVYLRSERRGAGLEEEARAVAAAALSVLSAAAIVAAARASAAAGTRRGGARPAGQPTAAGGDDGWGSLISRSPHCARPHSRTAPPPREPTTGAPAATEQCGGRTQHCPPVRRQCLRQRERSSADWWESHCSGREQCWGEGEHCSYGEGAVLGEGRALLLGERAVLG